MVNEYSLEKIVKAVTQEVLRELAETGGIRTAEARTGPGATQTAPGSERLDMSAYKTPLVTENSIRRLHELTGSIIVPAAARITPRAKELLREKNIKVIYDNK